MNTITYRWKNWESIKPIVDYIENNFPCFISVCHAMNYVRIECRKEDARRIKYLLNHFEKKY